VVEGFAGMHVKGGTLSFRPFLPCQWNVYTFNIRFRGNVIRIKVDSNGGAFTNLSATPVTINVFGNAYTIAPSAVEKVKYPDSKR